MAAEVHGNQFAALSGGVRLHYASAGEKGRPLILFLHGFPEFWYAWEAQLREFGTDFFAVAPDLRGFNLSDMPAGLDAYKARHIVDDILGLATHLGYDKFILVAHDWGGAVAWNLAISFPERLHKLVIINAPHPYLFMKALATDPLQQKASKYMNWLRKQGSEDALAKDDFVLLESFLNGGGPSAEWFSDEVRKKYHECWSRGLTGGVNYYRASPLHPPTGGADRLPGLQWNANDFRVTTPTCVIWGEQDTALPKSLLDGLEDFVDILDMERIPEGTHWVIHEQPERVNRRIRKFVSG